MQPLEGVSVIVAKARRRTVSNKAGYFQLLIPEAGTYRVQFRAPGYQTTYRLVVVSASRHISLRMHTKISSAGSYTAEAERGGQKAAKHSMSVEQLKSVPATFGDAIHGLSILPGVERDQLFGKLNIRGITSNIYYIDGIPVIRAQHFGLLHSLIGTNMMERIDLYSSAFPAKYGGTVGGIIAIKTKDNVPRFTGAADVGIITTGLFLASPWGTYGPADPADCPADNCGRAQDEPEQVYDGSSSGYWMASGRFGYLSVLVPQIVETLTGDTLDQTVNYMDYQFKSKFYASESVSYTMLLFGGNDSIFGTNRSKRSNSKRPLIEYQTHTQGLRFAYEPSSKLRTAFVAHNSWNEALVVENAGLRGFNALSEWRPIVSGLSNETEFRWLKDHANLTWGGLINRYDTKLNGWGRLQPTETDADGNTPNKQYWYSANKDYYDAAIFIENTFQYNGLNLTPGLRHTYDDKSGQKAYNYRLAAAYRFPSDTELSGSRGSYTQFSHTNPAELEEVLVYDRRQKLLPTARIDSVHRTLGLSQELGQFLLKVEGYVNTFEADEPVIGGQYPEPSRYSGGDGRARGVEISFRKLQNTTAALSWFAWSSFTFGEIDQQLTIEQLARPNTRVLKVLAGVRHKNSTFSLRFQHYGPLLYNPVIGANGPSSDGSYEPVFSDKKQPLETPYSLDLRFEYKSHYRWGRTTVFIEVLNVNNYQPSYELFDYTQPYQKGKNPYRTRLQFFGIPVSMIPNFGAEVIF